MRTRKHIRLREFDYSSANAYFITICTRNFVSHFGEIRNGVMCLNLIGAKAHQSLLSVSETRSYVEVDEVIVMPNHIHCILEIKKRISSDFNYNKFSKPLPHSISTIINQYKGRVKKWCDKNGYPEFEWQGRFHDHVIRDNTAYWAIKNYIVNNPSKWSQDKYRSERP